MRCEDPGTPVNGKQANVKDDYYYGGSVEFACKDNYTLGGESTIYCEETKKWSSPIPKCWGTFKLFFLLTSHRFILINWVEGDFPKETFCCDSSAGI